MAFTCPDGHELQGTLETLMGVALAEPKRLKSGKVIPEYAGETEVWWDEQRTVRRKGQDLWICTAGDSFRACDLVP